MKKNVAPVPFNYRDVEKVKALKERVDNVINLVDPFDKLIMLKKLSSEVNDAYSCEIDSSRPKSYVEPLQAIGGILGGAAAGCGAMVLFAAMPTLAVLSATALLVGGLAGGVVYGSNARERSLNHHRHKYSDMNEYHQMATAINAELEKMQKLLDPNDIALSPRAREIFNAFPRLKEEFMLVNMIEKVRTADAEQKALPSLDKQKPISSPPSSGN